MTWYRSRFFRRFDLSFIFIVDSFIFEHRLTIDGSFKTDSICDGRRRFRKGRRGVYFGLIWDSFSRNTPTAEPSKRRRRRRRRRRPPPPHTHTHTHTLIDEILFQANRYRLHNGRRMLVTRFDWVLPGLLSFYWVLPSFTGFYLILLRSTGLYWCFTGFYLVLLGFTWYCYVLLGYTDVVLGFTELYSVFMRFYWVLLSFTSLTWFCCVSTGFYWTLPSFTGFYLVFRG